MKRIQFTSGCPNDCKFCYEPKEIKTYNPEIPKEDFQILDMNFLANPNLNKILSLMILYYDIRILKKELVCGIDYRLLTQSTANKLYLANFKKIRWAWDYTFTGQKKHRKVFQMLVKAGYKPEELSVFMIVNWKIPYTDCCRKLDLLKVWNVKVNDCCWDGGYKLAKPVYWKPEQIKKFRAKCRKHNQLVRFKIDPEYKS